MVIDGEQFLFPDGSPAWLVGLDLDTTPERMGLRVNRGLGWRDQGYTFGPVRLFFGLQELIKSMRVMKTRKCIAPSFPYHIRASIVLNSWIFFT